MPGDWSAKKKAGFLSGFDEQVTDGCFERKKRFPLPWCIIIAETRTCNSKKEQRVWILQKALNMGGIISYLWPATLSTTEEMEAHWNNVHSNQKYTQSGDLELVDALGWFEDVPDVSISFIALSRIQTDDAIVSPYVAFSPEYLVVKAVFPPLHL